MFRAIVLFAFLALCSSHEVHPVYPVVPAVHSFHAPPLLYPYRYPLHHGYAEHGLLGHGLVAKPLAHHILKRSPHYDHLGHLGVGHVAPIAHVAPVARVGPVVSPLAVSHQSRVDVHTSPAVVAAPVVGKPLVAQLIPASPFLYKSVGAPHLYYGVGHYGSVYPHLAHSHY